jgi:hypothetical protein
MKTIRRAVIPACPESFLAFRRIPDLPAGRQARFTCGNDNFKVLAAGVIIRAFLMEGKKVLL